MNKKKFENPVIEKINFNLKDSSLCTPNASGLFADGQAASGDQTGVTTASGTSSMFGDK